MIDELSRLIENVIDIRDNEKFCAIIGLNPSKGARSPSLWNSVFENMSIPMRMIPLDVTDTNIIAVLEFLENNPNFVAGALAVPYKEIAFDHFYSRLDPTVKKIGAVNCILRKPDGRLSAVNTDGEGAVSALEAAVGIRKYKKAIVLGSGGTAKAVAAYLSPELGFVESLCIASRSKVPGLEVAESCGADWLAWSDISVELPDVDLVVNCTTVGSQSDVHSSPLTETQLGMLATSAIVYDVIYQPTNTKLLQFSEAIGLLGLGGLGMNLEQAVIACGKALGDSVPSNKIRKIMLTVG